MSFGIDKILCTKSTNFFNVFFYLFCKKLLQYINIKTEQEKTMEKLYEKVKKNASRREKCIFF